MNPFDDDGPLPPIQYEYISASEMLRLEEERRAQNTPEARLMRLAQHWHDAGERAYREGKKRTDYPFKPLLRRHGLDIAWQTGWDTGALFEALKTGVAAQRDDACPYKKPALAARWRQGWHITHSLQVVGKKNPASRKQDAKPGDA